MSRQLRSELLEAVSNSFRASQNQSDVFDEHAARLLGINRTDLRCMDIIQRREPASAGDVAREAGLTSGAMTAVIDRLERVGLVRRVADAHDRRKVGLALTPAATRAGERIWGPLHEDWMRRMAAVPDRDLRTVVEFMQLGADMMEDQIARVAAMKPGRRPPAVGRDR